jgi:hypothetical protein
MIQMHKQRNFTDLLRILAFEIGARSIRNFARPNLPFPWHTTVQRYLHAEYDCPFSNFDRSVTVPQHAEFTRMDFHDTSEDDFDPFASMTADTSLQHSMWDFLPIRTPYRMSIPSVVVDDGWHAKTPDQEMQ